MPEEKAKGLIGMYPLAKGKGMGCGRVMSILYSVGVVSRGPLGPGQFKYNYYPLFAVHPCFCFFHLGFKVLFGVMWKGFWNKYAPQPKCYEIGKDGRNSLPKNIFCSVRVFLFEVHWAGL